MSKTLILMRHAKAEATNGDTPDFDRHLTDAGARSLRATLPDALKHISVGSMLTIWSSPALRAIETAEIVARCCQRCKIDVSDDIVKVDALFDQDYDAFVNLLNANNDKLLVVVGHDPFISEATELLTGSRIDFATGALAAIDLPSTNELPVSTSATPSQDTTGQEASDAPIGRLLWFEQGPVSKRWKTLVELENIISKASDVVPQRMDAFIANPDDPETNHKLRVSIRTLRSLIDFISPWQNRSQNERIQSDLKTIVAETSRLRELDVFALQAAEMEGCSYETIAYCSEKAAKERDRVVKVLSSKRMRKYLEHAINESRHIVWRKSVSENGLAEEDISTRFNTVSSHLAAQLDLLDLAEVELTHDLRKRAKQVRYVAENFDALVSNEAVDKAKEMTSHQDNLGAICDANLFCPCRSV